MAKLKGPLFSIDAHASIGNELTYSSRKSGSQVRFQKKQKDIETAARSIQRGFFIKAAAWWNLLTPTEQDEWHAYGLEG